MKGWYGNKHRHSLASRGISTREMRYIVEYTQTIDYNEPEEIIVGFWVSSLKNDYSNFDFDKAFSRLNKTLQERSAEWGYLGIEAWKKVVEYDVIVDNLCFEDEVFCTKYEELVNSDSSEKEMDKFVFEYTHNLSVADSDMFEVGIYNNIFDLYKQTLNPPRTLREKIILMDKLVNATHDRGSIWDGDDGYGFIDIPQLRKKVEKAWELENRGVYN